MRRLISLVIISLIATATFFCCSIREPMGDDESQKKPEYYKPGVASSLHTKHNDWIISREKLQNGTTFLFFTWDILSHRKNLSDDYKYTFTASTDDGEDIFFAVGNLGWRTKYYNHANNPDSARGDEFEQSQKRYIWTTLKNTEQAFYLVADLTDNFNNQIKFVSNELEHPFYDPDGNGIKSGYVKWEIKKDQGIARAWAPLAFIDVERSNPLYREPVTTLNFSIDRGDKLWVCKFKTKIYHPEGNDKDWFGIGECEVQIFSK